MSITWISRVSRIVLIVLFVAALLGTQPVLAQETPPAPDGGELPGALPRHALESELADPGTQIDPQTGMYYAQEGALEGMDANAWGYPGPDYYGYTWANVPISWMDIHTTGAIIPFSTYNWPMRVQLPFPFKYYENTYNAVYVGDSGYATFTDDSYRDDQSRIPDPNMPNNVIAPYWSPLVVKTSGAEGRVYYASGGSPGSRYFIVQWYRLRGQPGYGEPIGEDDLFDFEMILYENGNIRFQYNTMTYLGPSYWCGYSGIEDLRGTDGLSYMDTCGQTPATSAVQFTRPGPMSRLLLYPDQFGGFGKPGSVAEIKIPFKNTGETGAANYLLYPNCSWPVTLYNPSTGAELVDQTGPVAQGAIFTVGVRVTMPLIGNVGDSPGTCTLQISPETNTNKTRVAVFSAAVPAPFVEVFEDGVDGANHMMIVQPDTAPNQTNIKTTGDYYNSNQAAVAEAPNGNLVTAWVRGRCSNDPCDYYYREVALSIRSHSGGLLLPPARIQDWTGWNGDVIAYDPAVAVAPDGTIAVTWQSVAYNASYQYQYNIFLATFTPTGAPLSGVVNVTGNTQWATWSTANVPHFYAPAIAASGDNRFTLAWERYFYTGSAYTDDIYSAAYSRTGAKLSGPNKMTADTTDPSDAFYEPRLAALSGLRVMLVYHSNYADDLLYQVLDTAGGAIQTAANLTNDGTSRYEYGHDVVQLSSGKILVAWYVSRQIDYLLLDANFNPIYYGSGWDMSPLWDVKASVTRDSAGNGIVTWTDDISKSLYYALVNPDGSQTPAMAIHNTDTYLDLGWNGSHSTSYTIPASTEQMDLYTGSKPMVALPGSLVTLNADFGNRGLTTGTNVTLMAGWPAGLGLVSKNPDASCFGESCTWYLPNMEFLGSGAVAITFSVPGDAEPGTIYPVTFQISGAETDGQPGNNTVTVNVIVGGSAFYLPALRR